ncbi:MAG: hypothetical protein N2484_08460 [Clostridia bacterium]|nr:hypothetical protein [Clostridia bacterium]
MQFTYGFAVVLALPKHVPVCKSNAVWTVQRQYRVGLILKFRNVSFCLQIKSDRRKFLYSAAYFVVRITKVSSMMGIKISVMGRTIADYYYLNAS